VDGRTKSKKRLCCDVIKALIKKGASIHSKNRADQCVLDFVIRSNNQKMIDLISEYINPKKPLLAY